MDRKSQCTELPVAEIQVGEHRVRGVDAGVVALLRESIERVGLIQRIIVGPGGELIAGLQRLTAVASLGWEQIPVEVLDSGEIERQIFEIDENLTRGELEGWARVRALARQKELYEALHPETTHGGNAADRTRAEDGTFAPEDQSPQNADTGRVPSFTAKAAALMGKDRATVERATRLGAAFSETEIELLEEAGVPPTRALDIARLPKAERDAVVAAVQDQGGKQLKTILGPDRYGKALGERRPKSRAEEWQALELKNGRGPADNRAKGTAPAAPNGKPLPEKHLNGDVLRAAEFRTVPVLKRAAQDLVDYFNQPGELEALLTHLIILWDPEDAVMVRVLTACFGPRFRERLNPASLAA